MLEWLKTNATAARDKLSTEVSKFKNREFMEAVVSGCALVAAADGTEVGHVTSGSFAPSLGYVIAFAWVAATHAADENFVVRAARTELPATRVEAPFYTEGTARKKLA